MTVEQIRIKVAIMTNEEILRGAIEKAKQGGYGFRGEAKRAIGTLVFLSETKNVPIIFNATTKYIIFSHEFARAFWGEDNNHYLVCAHGNIVYQSWQYHLQCMVLEAEPLKYLEKFLK